MYVIFFDENGVFKGEIVYENKGCTIASIKGQNVVFLKKVCW